MDAGRWCQKHQDVSLPIIKAKANPLRSGSPSKSDAFSSSSTNNMSDISSVLRILLAEAPEAVPHVFCDMDGVVADFYTGLSRAMKIPIQDVERFLQHEGWSAVERRVPNLFATLPVLSDASKLINGLVELRDDGRIRLSMLTAIPNEWAAQPTMRKLSKKNKIDWMRQHFPSVPSSNVLVVLRAEKQRYASAQRAMHRPPAILIDDYTKNIREWNSAGGWGILHTSSVTSLQTLHKYLGRV